MLGFQWDNLAKSGHKLAVGFGAPQYIVSTKGDDPDAAELAVEASLQLKVADKISVIPAVFYLPEQSQGVEDASQFGGVVQTVIIRTAGCSIEVVP